MITSRSLDDLLPVVKRMAEELIKACGSSGIDLLITSTYRDLEAQAELYAKGRTTAGPIVTCAKPGESLHNHRVALDFCPIEDGKCAWNDLAAFERVGELAETIGFEWAGRWTGKMREEAHVQYTGGLTIAQLESGLMPTPLVPMA
jgi:peptidoglycan L-alanyl-D-glutamate endopeptidase CwlK